MIWLVLAMAMLTGCSTQAPWIIQKGGDGQGAYLSTVIVVGREHMAKECQNDHALACVHTNQWTEWGGISVQRYFGVFARAASIPREAYEVVAHEVCHYVADVHEIYPDPCHQEDKGVIRYQP